MRGRRHLGHAAQQLDIGRRMIELVVADQAAIGLAAELAIFLFIDLLEDRALVPGRALELLECPAELLLRDVEDADLQGLVGLGVVHQIMQPAPGRFQGLEVGVVQDQIDLLGQLLVERCDHRLNRVQRVVRDDRRVPERLLCERAHRRLDGFERLVRFRPELLLQKRGEIAGFREAGGAGGEAGLLRGHVSHSPLGSVLDEGAEASACSMVGSASNLAIRSSAPVLPSI